MALEHMEAEHFGYGTQVVDFVEMPLPSTAIVSWIPSASSSQPVQLLGGHVARSVAHPSVSLPTVI